MAMSIARIRTPNNPLDAASNYRGHTYVGFGGYQDYQGGTFADQHCEQRTTLDRTPPTLEGDITNAHVHGPLWLDEDDGDGEWLPEDESEAGSEMLEYDTEAESSEESLDISQCDDTYTSILNALRELHAPPPPRHLPRGTWRNGYMYTREQVRPQSLRGFLRKTSLRLV